jgi:hypothetical protein
MHVIRRWWVFGRAVPWRLVLSHPPALPHLTFSILIQSVFLLCVHMHRMHPSNNNMNESFVLYIHYTARYILFSLQLNSAQLNNCTAHRHSFYVAKGKWNDFKPKCKWMSEIKREPGKLVYGVRVLLLNTQSLENHTSQNEAVRPCLVWANITTDIRIENSWYMFLY